MKKILQSIGISLVGISMVMANVPETGRSLVSLYQNTDPRLAQFDVTGQPFLVFRYKKGFKYPVVLKGDPRFNRWDMLLLGRYSQKYGENTCVKKSHDLENLAVLRSIENYTDGGAGFKFDKLYQGFREPYAAVTLEQLFGFLGFGATSLYKGTILADEYKEGVPMRWVLGSAADVKALSKYFAKQGVVPSETKPLLLLQLLDDNLGQEELEFLDTHFTLLDPGMPAVKAFFDSAEEYLAESAAGSKDAKVAAECFADSFFRTFVDKQAEGLDGKKIMGVAFQTAVLATCVLFQNEIKGAVLSTDAWAAVRDTFVHVEGTKDKPQYRATDIAKHLGLAVGSITLLFVLYRTIAEIFKVDDDIEDEVVVE